MSKSKNYGKDISSVNTPIRFHLPNGSTLQFRNSAEALAWFNQNYPDGYSMIEYIPTLGDSSHPTELKEITITAPIKLKTTPTRKGVDMFIGANYSPSFNRASTKLGMNPLNWTKHIPSSYWNSNTHKAIHEGNNIAAGIISAPTIAHVTSEYALPWLAKNIIPYLSARGWLGATLAAGNTPAWLTPTSATAIDAALAGSATGASINDIRENGPTVGNVLGTVLGVGGLAYEAAPTVTKGINAARNAVRPAVVGIKMRTTNGNENKYIQLLGKLKESDVFNGTIKDRSLITRPFAEYLESLGINSLKFTETDLNNLMALRSKSVLKSIPQDGRSAVVYESKPRNGQTLFSIDLNEDGRFIGNLEARSHVPNHPRSNEVTVDMIERNNLIPSKGLSEDGYNSAIDYIHLTGIGEGLVSGERLLSPEITYKVWKHYPNRKVLRTNGHHSFGIGRDVVGTSGVTVREIHEGPVVMLNTPSKKPVPMKSSFIFHPDMIKNGKLLPPNWNKYGIYYTLPLILAKHGMLSN